MANRAYLPSLQSRDFRLIAAGQMISLTGTQMQQVAVAWQLWQLTHSAWSLGALGFFRVVPIITLGIAGGVIADAFDRRRMMLATQILMSCSSVGLAAVTLSGHMTPAVIYGLSFLSGVATAFDAPTRQALVPMLVPREHLANALSVYATGFQVSSVVGPALGGLVLAKFGLVAVYLCDVVSFGAVLLALLFLHFRPAAASSRNVSWSAVAEGLRFLRGRPILLSTMLLDFFATFFGGSMLLMPIFADQLLKVGAEGLGTLYSAQPLGALAAALVLSARPAIHRQGAAVVWSVLAYGAAIAAFGASSDFRLAVLFLAVSGAADTVSMVVRQTLRQIETPDDMRGRVTSVGMIFFRGGPQLGEVEAGAVAKLFGPRISVVSGGLLCMLVVGATAAIVPALYSYRDRQRSV